jgi:cell division protein ZapA (FtsZ GTPase activity inhibitor)
VKKQVDKARRILAAEAQLYRIEQLKMAALERRTAELEAEQVALIAALNDSDALQGLFIDTTARRLTSISEEAERVKREKAAQGLKLREHAARVKVSERVHREHALEFEREKEGKALLDVVEQVVTRKPTSLP